MKKRLQGGERALLGLALRILARKSRRIPVSYRPVPGSGSSTHEEEKAPADMRGPSVRERERGGARLSVAASREGRACAWPWLG